VVPKFILNLCRPVLEAKTGNIGSKTMTERRGHWFLRTYYIAVSVSIITGWKEVYMPYADTVSSVLKVNALYTYVMTDPHKYLNVTTTISFDKALYI
jgi:hypothetical protein